MNTDGHVVGVFKDGMAADMAISQMSNVGISPSNISLLVNENGRNHHFKIDENKSKTAEGAGYGAVLGGLAAGLTAAAAGIVSVTVPGAIFIAGPLAVSMAAGAAGAAVGGLTGALIGVGIPEDEVKLVERELGDGSMLVAAHGLTDAQKKTATESMKSSGAIRVH